MPNWEFIMLHCSATTDHGVLNDTEAIRRHHKEVRGWDDIGYHFVVEKVDGVIKTNIGRPVTKPGAHCRHDSMNYRALGVCVVGDFDHTPPDADLYDYVARQIRTIQRMFELPIDNVVPHRDYNPNKTCPGAMFDMSRLKELVASYA